MSAFPTDIISLVTLIFLEIILGIDNIVFVAITSQTLPKKKQKLARKLGLSLALITRLLLLSIASILANSHHVLFSILNKPVSIRDLLFLLGGAFLVFKSTEEIHAQFQVAKSKNPPKTKSLLYVILQIAVLDIVFSFDSVITAIAMTPKFYIMVMAICVAILAMIIASEKLSKLIDENPTIKVLALSYIMMIGTILIADGSHYHVPRGYIYFSMIFSLFVESINIKLQKAKT